MKLPENFLLFSSREASRRRGQQKRASSKDRRKTVYLTVSQFFILTYGSKIIDVFAKT